MPVVPPRSKERPPLGQEGTSGGLGAWRGLSIGEPTPALRDRCRFGEGFSSLHPLRRRGLHKSSQREFQRVGRRFLGIFSAIEPATVTTSYSPW